jgi:hypothetical protein
MLSMRGELEKTFKYFQRRDDALVDHLLDLLPAPSSFLFGIGHHRREIGSRNASAASKVGLAHLGHLVQLQDVLLE